MTLSLSLSEVVQKILFQETFPRNFSIYRKTCPADGSDCPTKHPDIPPPSKKAATPSTAISYFLFRRISNAVEPACPTAFVTAVHWVTILVIHPCDTFIGHSLWWIESVEFTLTLFIHHFRSLA